MKVHHDREKKRFVVTLGTYEANLMYTEKDGVLDFYHIYVPDPYRNKGVAAKILIEAFEYAKKEGYRVVPTCPFIANDFLSRFSKYQDIVKPGEFPFI